MPDLGVLARDTITLLNYEEANADGSRATTITFDGFSNTEIDANDVMSGINSTSFSGSGLNDATYGGVYNGSGAKTFSVRINQTGTPDTFEYSFDDFSTTEATNIGITGSAQDVANGVTITFGATTGHTVNDKWQMAAITTLTTPARMGQISVSHDGTGADDKGKIEIKLNDGNDGNAPTLGTYTSYSNGHTDIAGSLNLGSTGGLTITDGNLTITAGNVVFTNGNVTVTSGTITITSGDISMGAGKLDLTGNITSSAGKVNALAFNVTQNSYIGANINTTGEFFNSSGVKAFLTVRDVSGTIVND